MAPSRARLDTGVNQKRAGDFNERLLLSLIHRQGTASAGSLAQQVDLSFQTVSTILRRLEQDGLAKRGKPVRGQIGKPMTPVMIDPDGAYAFGLKIGRRSADLLLLDLSGARRASRRFAYDSPNPADILKFLKSAMARVKRGLTADQQRRIVGLGVARPGKLGDWPEGLALPSAAPTASWDRIDLESEIARFSDLPVFIENDATAACQAEYAFGAGKLLTEFAYVFVGTFVGGGVVINDTVFRGRRGHAGAFGAIRVTSTGRETQLVECASLHLLETALRERGLDPAVLLNEHYDWQHIEAVLAPWIDRVGAELARAIVNICGVVDFDRVLVDGGFPPHVRQRLVARIRDEFARLDTRGILPVRIEEGQIGRDARAIGAAASPLIFQFFPGSRPAMPRLPETEWALPESTIA